MGSVVEREPVKCPTYFGQSHPTVASMATLPFASSAFLAYSTGTKSVISRGSQAAPPVSTLAPTNLSRSGETLIEVVYPTLELLGMNAVTDPIKIENIAAVFMVDVFSIDDEVALQLQYTN